MLEVVALERCACLSLMVEGSVCAVYQQCCSGQHLFGLNQRIGACERVQVHMSGSVQPQASSSYNTDASAECVVFE